MKRGLGLHEDEIASIFETWNKGVLDSFLIEITTNVLKFKDNDGGATCYQDFRSSRTKGYRQMDGDRCSRCGNPRLGNFSRGENGISPSIEVTLIGEAVFARCLSALKEERTRASKILSDPPREFKGDKQQFIDDLEQVSGSFSYLARN